MKMSNRTKIIAAISAAFVLFILILVLAVNAENMKPHTKVAFYRIPQTRTEAIQKTFQALNTEKKQKYYFRFYTLNPDKTLASQIKSKYDVVIAPEGLSTKQLVESLGKKTNKTGYSTDTVLGNSVSVNFTTILSPDQKKIALLPLALDHMEITFSRSFYKMAGLEDINSWTDVEKIAAKAKDNSTLSIVFAAGDDTQLLNLLGAMTESLEGKKAFDQAVNIIREATVSKDKKHQLTDGDFDKLAEELLGEGKPMHSTAVKLGSWKNANYMFTNPYSLTKSDVKNFMKQDNAAIVLETLSEHREVEHRIIEGYDSTYFPSGRKAELRNLTAPVYCAIPLSTSKVAQQTVTMLATTSQGTLSFNTGLAPAKLNCSVPDRQADNVRYWVASTNAPSAPLAEAAFTDGQTRAKAAAAIRNYLNYR